MNERLKKFFTIFKETITSSYYFHFYYKQEIQNYSILIESKSGSGLAANMFYILKHISQEDNFKTYKKYLILNKGKRKQINELLDNYNINNVKIIFKNSLKYYKILATVKYLFNDNTFPNWFIKKENQIYTNIWDDIPLKKIGKDYPKKAYAISNIQRNLLMSNYLVFSSFYMYDKIIHAYMLENISKSTKVLMGGLPRNEIFFDKDRIGALKKKFELIDKQVIIYTPMTHKAYHDNRYESNLKSYLKKIDAELTDKQIFYIKLNNYIQNKINFKNYKHIKKFPRNVEMYQFLNISDCLITNYSNILFDFANTGNKVIIFSYDLLEYIENGELYIELSQLPFPIVTTIEDLISEINKPKEYDDKEFLEKYCTYENKYASKRLCDFVIFGKNEVEIREIENNYKETLLIYTGGLHKNGITTSILSLMSELDLYDKNYLFVFRARSFIEHPEKIKLIPSKINYIPLAGKIKYSILELLASYLFYSHNLNNFFVKKYLDRLYKRELKRRYGFVNIDKSIHFSGYEKRIISLLQRFEQPKYIFAHSNMLLELYSKGNQHLLTLEEAYKNYDKVAVVSKSVGESIEKISEGKAKIAVVNNCFNYQEIVRKSEQKILFDRETRITMKKESFLSLLDSSVLKFITIGRFSVEKGHQRLIHAFNQFNKYYSDSYLIIIGGYGELYRETVNYVKSLPNRNKIIIIKSISNPINILKKCDLFILSSLYEGLPLVILEATMVGVPVISTNIPGARELIEKYNGYLVANNEEGILSGMYDLVNGKIKPMHIDFDKYNENSKRQFENLIKK